MTKKRMRLLLVAAVACGLSAHAGMIRPDAEVAVGEIEYFSTFTGSACDFEEGTTGRIAELGSGLTEVKVADGILSFLTGAKENYFTFGRHFYPKGPQDIPDEKIIKGQPRHSIIRLTVRIRQSLPTSTWEMQYRESGKGNAPGRLRSQNAKLEGTDWQEMSFNLSGRDIIRTLYIATTEPGNRVQIDFVKVFAVKIPVYYRHKLTLDAPPVFGKFQVNLPGSHEIYVNGKLVCAMQGYIFDSQNPVFDITSYLKAGENTIAVGSDNCVHARTTHDGYNSFKFLCAGAVLTEKGTYAYINSNTNDWKGTFVSQDGWMEPGFDDSSWPGVKPTGDSRQEFRLRQGPVHYTGPLTLTRKEDPIFKMEEGVDLSLILPKGYRIAYALTNSFSRVQEASGELEKKKETDMLERHTLRYRAEHPGVWELTLKMMGEDGSVVASRLLEVAVAGPIHQKKVAGDTIFDGMELTKVAEIDCTDDSDPRLYTFKGHASSTVVEKPFGSYRESETKAWGGFGYTFAVSNLYRPHLIEVEYPDDANRHMQAKVFSAGNDAAKNPAAHNWDWNYEQRWHSGVITGHKFPVSSSFRKLYLLFWPDTSRNGNSIQMINQQGGEKSAARKITVYEIDDLPMLDLPDTPDRLFGMFVEREHIVANTMYSGKYNGRFERYGYYCNLDRVGRLRDWYITTENLIKYLRFSGQNLYIPGYFMYFGTYFPETGGRSRLSGYRCPTDHFRLMAAMFDENDLYLMLGCEYGNSVPPRGKTFPTNWETRHEGAETIFAVNRTGRQSNCAGGSLQEVYDYQNPAVEDDIFLIMRIFLDYVGDYKSVKGICFNTRGISFPCLPEAYIGSDANTSLEWGWQDSAVKAFEEKTGVKIPVPKTDPERFQKRYDYVTGNAEVLEKWIQFRCERVHDQIVRLANLVRKARPDLRIYINEVFPAPGDREWITDDEVSYKEAMRKRGVDRSMYREEGIVLLPEVYNDWNPAWDRVLNPEIREYWKDSEGFYRPRRTPAHTFTILPPEPYAYWAYSMGMIDCTASVIDFSQADIQITTGAEQRFRPFVRAYRNIPAGSYKTLSGTGVEEGLVVRAAAQDDGTAFYVVNPSQEPMTGEITFSGATRVVDLVDGTEEGIKDKSIRFSLSPFGMRVFRVDGKVISAVAEKQ